MSRIIFGFLCLAAMARQGMADTKAISFNKDIRPILSDRCFTCHGPDAEKRQAGLRLDTIMDATAFLESGSHALVPRKPSRVRSLRINSKDPDIVMPPPEVGKPVTQEEAQLFAQWIAEGAQYEKHWALSRLKDR